MPTWLLRLLLIVGAFLLVAAAVATVVKGYEHWRGSVYGEGDKAGAARVQALWNKDREQAQEAALAAAAAAAKETQRRLDRQQENQRVYDERMARAVADAARARAAADGLQLRAATYLEAAGCGALSGDSAVACVREAVARIGDALGQCGAIARRAAAEADDARERGLACERDYDALALKPAAP